MTETVFTMNVIQINAIMTTHVTPLKKGLRYSILQLLLRKIKFLPYCGNNCITNT